jgi:hypothetical protein
MDNFLSFEALEPATREGDLTDLQAAIPGPFNALMFGGLGRVSPKCHTPKPTALG